MYKASMRFHTTVEKRAEIVFDYVSDLSRHGEWAANPLTITSLSDEPIGVGKAYRSLAEVRSLTFEADLVVSTFERSNRFGFKGEDSTGKFKHTFLFVPLPMGSKIERIFEFELTFRQWLLFYLLYLPVRRPAGLQAMARLKKELEGGS
ncbi:MAG: hypothetical protein AAF633_02405 [Chloroflexota bacterium]